MNRGDWFKEAEWGVFIHFLADANTPAESWDGIVDDFDAAGLAGQVSTAGAGYLFLTIGQNSGHYCSPNSTYDDLVGIRPSKCSGRDLVLDLADALDERDLRLMVYLPSGAPAADDEALGKLGWRWGYEGKWPAGGRVRRGQRLAGFQLKWEAVIREWSLRWGSRVSGWWIDGCYFSDQMYRHREPPNFESFASALRAGNPDSIVAFNPGVMVPVITLTEYEDYTAGEISEAFPICPGEMVGNARYHVLSYLGERWGSGRPRFCEEFVRGYTRDVNQKGGVVTWEVPIEENGLVQEAFMDQLESLSG